MHWLLSLQFSYLVQFSPCSSTSMRFPIPWTHYFWYNAGIHSLLISTNTLISFIPPILLNAPAWQDPYHRSIYFCAFSALSLGCKTGKMVTHFQFGFTSNDLQSHTEPLNAIQKTFPRFASFSLFTMGILNLHLPQTSYSTSLHSSFGRPI